MSRRVIGLIAAVALALLGTVALVAFVAGAEERALEGEELVEVYIVSDLITAGTPGEELSELVLVDEVPAKVRPNNAVDNLAALRGRVASVDLQPGEQLIDSRFVALSEFADREVGVDIPEDMVEVTVALDPARAVGGLLEPGQTVAVLASFEPFQLSETAIDVDGELIPVPGAVAGDTGAATANTTDMLLRKVLVTAVQEDTSAAFNGGGNEEVNRLQEAPDGSLLVTLAIRPFDAERVVFAAEFGTLWLAVERDTVPDVDDPATDRGNIYLGEEEDQREADLPTPLSDTTTDSAADETDPGADQTEDGGNP